MTITTAAAHAVYVARNMFRRTQSPPSGISLEQATILLGGERVFSAQVVSTLLGDVPHPSELSYRLPYTENTLREAAKSGAVVVWEWLSLRQIGEYIEQDGLQLRLSDQVRFQYDVGALKVPQWSLIAMGKGSVGAPVECFERSLGYNVSIPSARTIVAAMGYYFLLNRKPLFDGRPVFTANRCGNERLIVRQMLQGGDLQIRLSLVPRVHREPALGTPIAWNPDPAVIAH